MTYWFPQVELCRNFPVWSLQDFRISDDAEMVTKRLCVRMLSISWGEAKSRGAENGIYVVIFGFLDWQFLCCILIWHLLVASNFGRCFVMRVGVRFGQESRCPHFTDLSSVYGFGLKAQACRCFDKSCFVLAWRMMLLACGCLHGTTVLLNVFFIVVVVIGTSNN